MARASHLGKAHWHAAVALLAGVCFCTLGVPPQVLAQAGAEEATRAAARQLGEEGLQALFDGQIGSAEERLDRAYRLFATPTLGLWSARAYVRAGHLLEAAERYQETVHLAADVGNVAAQKSAQQEAARELEALHPRVPSLTIQLERAPQQLRITLDGSALRPEILGVAMPSNPGVHVLVASAGDVRFETSFTLTEGQRLVVPIVWPERPVAPAPPEVARQASEPPRPSAPKGATDSPARGSSGSFLKPLGVVSMSVGAASLVASGITALLARGTLDDCSKVRGTHVCSRDADADAYERLRAASAVTFYAGLGLTAAGLTAYLLAPANPERASLELGPGAVSVHTRF